MVAHLSSHSPALPVGAYRGAETIAAFSARDEELAALTARAGVYDLSYRAFIKITGSDRIRWTNGMVSNTIVGLEEGQGNYSFLLNAQGRVLGDATIYRFADHLLLETDRAQVEALIAHLDHFIIMDDVELQPLDASTTAIGIAGPAAMQVLSQLGFALPPENHFIPSKWQSAEITVTHARSPLVPRFEIRIASADAPAFWAALTASGVIPCGSAALEALRILEGTPLYGVDITDRHLPQETAQPHALNFSKGCYLGQEIVERIRSRATVHRTFRQFSLSQPPGAFESGDQQPLSLEAEGAQQNPAGQLSSIAEYHLPGFTGTLALGFIRTEVLERKLPIACSGSAVTPLDAPPKLG
ncbi:CAF17-like 4Fe-4S cluster assembly/insertion protein YgfZ [Silvibacterium bohemicum]|uniref:CAF17-like 4Fe-4S cluster assembly/insertion protein YgfZ n=1 Tax=Silvibacterium bohemicum TaxID=1577686 RepID=UPI0021A4EF2A|nr:folate-binding protein [Silvibacterium bohemicum]